MDPWNEHQFFTSPPDPELGSDVPPWRSGHGLSARALSETADGTSPGPTPPLPSAPGAGTAGSRQISVNVSVPAGLSTVLGKGIVILAGVALLVVAVPKLLPSGPSEEEIRTSIVHRCTDESRQRAASSETTALNGLVDIEETEPVSVRRKRTWEVTHGSHFVVLGNDIPFAMTCVYSTSEATDFSAKAGRLRIQIGDDEPMLLALNDNGEYDEVDGATAG